MYSAKKACASGTKGFREGGISSKQDSEIKTTNGPKPLEIKCNVFPSREHLPRKLVRLKEVQCTPNIRMEPRISLELDLTFLQASGETGSEVARGGIVWNVAFWTTRILQLALVRIPLRLPQNSESG